MFSQELGSGTENNTLLSQTDGPAASGLHIAGTFWQINNSCGGTEVGMVAEAAGGSRLGSSQILIRNFVVLQPEPNSACCELDTHPWKNLEIQHRDFSFLQVCLNPCLYCGIRGHRDIPSSLKIDHCP